MTRNVTVLLVAALAVAAACWLGRADVAAAGPPAKGAGELEGEWKLVEVWCDGQKVEDEDIQKGRFAFRGATFQASAVRTRSGTYRTDTTRSPKTIELVWEDDMKEEARAAGIYAVEPGKLKLCLSRDTDAPTRRPTEFKTTAGDGFLLEVYERVRPR